MELTGVSAVVTGGASGLGLATARRLVKGGAHVVLLDLESSDGADVAAELGPTARFVVGDVRTEDGVEPALEVASELGPLRAVVHCAGCGHAGGRCRTRNGSAPPTSSVRRPRSTSSRRTPSCAWAC